MTSSSADSSTAEVDFGGLGQWLAWKPAHPRFFDDAATDSIKAVV